MSKPIEPTPILEGNDAEKLLKDISSVKYNHHKQKFLEECKMIYSKTK
ncbi:hypothetical protein HYY69_03810 [Candidatus Woesearchaeota archaeon]|nr:hypothetical protein [Candidatus Woesearchaeota archaeon]